jgi:hypothetical protein
MADIKVGDWVKLTSGRGKATGPCEVVQVYGDNLSLKRDHIIIHNVHREDVAPASVKREAVLA